MSAPFAPRRVLIIEHERATPAGYVESWLAEHGSEIDQLRIDVEDREADARSYDLIVSLGSEFSASDDDVPFVEREHRLFLQGLEADVPILGICFGGQLLARALKAEVVKAHKAEIGWLTVETKDERAVPAGPWFQWHFDTFTLPEGATVIAENEVGPQVFTYGRSLGVQFHPEVTPEIMDGWVHAYRHELNAEGVDPDELLAETRTRAGESQARAAVLLEWYLDSVASAGGGDRREQAR
ncbi:MAG: type 1 glutamine amidotransferase [Acidimicrobiales bacterium]